jgi:high affinity sulfate transporter 1
MDLGPMRELVPGFLTRDKPPKGIASRTQGTSMLDTIVGYRKSWLRPDFIAGVTTAAVIIPKALAYATVAGVPVQVGMYTAFFPMLIYVLFGTSRPLSVSTTATIAVLVGTQLSQVVPDGDPALLVQALATLTFMVGGVLLLASIFHLGFLANFISEPVLIGFKGGIGLVIVMDQFPKLLGVHFAKGSFITNIVGLVGHLPEFSGATVVLAAITVAVLVTTERLAPKVPAPLLAVAIGIGGVAMFGLHDLGIATIGQIPSGFPSLTLPDFSFAAQLWPGALGIALMSFTETIAAGRAFAKNDEPSPRPNQELLATGLASVGGAFFGSLPPGGGTTQTAVNRHAGAKTQVAEIATAAVALTTMLFLAPLLGLMPEATLAVVVIVYSIGLIQPAEFRAVLKIRRMEFLWALAALVGVVFLGTLKGIIVAIMVSVVALSYQAANPRVFALGRKRGTNVFRPLSKEHPEDETFAGLLLIRMEGRAFFMNIDQIVEKIDQLVADANPKVVALHMRAVIDLEYTALKGISEAEKKLRERNVDLWLVGLNPGVLAVVRKSPLGKILGHKRMYFNLETAVATYLTSSSPKAPA